jgi:hypothetical protein
MNFMKFWSRPNSIEPDWMEQILVLNPWARGLTIKRGEADFQGARRRATLERFGQGRQGWNDWANGMLALRNESKELQNTWNALAIAVFSTHNDKHNFESDFDAREYIFCGDAIFESATFTEATEFGRASFGGNAKFDRATFGGTAGFGRVTFSRNAAFSRASFNGNARFDRATFAGNAGFGRAAFTGNAGFEDASFSGNAWFVSATFTGNTRFGRATFARNAVFGRASFHGDAMFEDTTFSGDISIFDTIESKAAFSLSGATFRQVPSLLGATFRGTLRLDNIVTPRFPLLGWTSDEDAPARFRDLRRRAEEAKDHDRELEFFAQEIRTSRFHSKRAPAFIPRVWEWRFWFGLLYGTFSDFGRSFFRPIAFWVILFLVSAVLYLGEYDGMKHDRVALGPTNKWQTATAYFSSTRDAWSSPPPCVPKDKTNANEFAATDAVSEALYLALKNGLVGFDVGRSDTARRIYGCLYGLASDADQSPIVPYRVSLISTVQTLASAALIFLFFLAMRNLLKLK